MVLSLMHEIMYVMSPGSLEHLDTRTPPQSLKIRTYSVEEQEEQEAASGTYDKRVRPSGCSVVVTATK